MNHSSSEPGFCTECGSILPLLKDIGDVQCFTCKRVFPPQVFSGMEVQYVINFNTSSQKMKKDVEKTDVEGPVVERRCPKCGNDKMSYATLQLRSADEGQTVFYTCIKCKHKETENS